MTLYIPAQINVETESGGWDAARNLYITMVMKGKLEIKDGNFVMTPKQAEIDDLIVKKGGEQKPQEAMMIQSVVNIQLDNLKKKFKPIVKPMNNLAQELPKWLVCYGIVPESTEVDIQYKKSQVQLSVYSTPNTNSEQQRRACKILNTSFMKKVVIQSDDNISMKEWVFEKLIEDMEEDVIAQLTKYKNMLKSFLGREEEPEDKGVQNAFYFKIIEEVPQILKLREDKAREIARNVWDRQT